MRKAEAKTRAERIDGGYRSGGGSVIGQDKVNTARYSTARTFSANPQGFSHGQRTVREVSRGTDRPAPFTQAKSTSEQPAATALRNIRNAILWLVVGAILIAIFAFAMRADRLVIAASDSSCPIGIYRLVHNHLARGELVEACLPDAIATYGVTRGYLTRGSCPNGSEPVIKIIGAIPGDRVDLSTEQIRVNGVALPASATLSEDSRGREVTTLARGPHKTGPDEVWLFGLHDARSWDSRYFGPVAIENVRGALEPVLAMKR